MLFTRVCGLLVLSAGALCRAEPDLRRSEEPDIRRDATVEAIERVMPSVVNIATETIIERHDFYDDLLRQFYGRSYGRPAAQKSFSVGSGVIIDADGYLLTNYHVVSRANRVQVKLWNGREYDADPIIIGSVGSDVALLKIRAATGEKFTAIKFARDDDLLLGETVLALGNPYGLGGSVTKGILSSKNRRPATGKEPLDIQDWLETDAAINPGNSGGPLVNIRGELIGLNVAVYREEEGMGLGFSIPIKQVSEALSEFFTPEWTDALWFGARLKAGPGPLTATFVQPQSPAAKAGLLQGDELLQIDGKETHGLITANRLLCAGAGQEKKVIVNRGGERRTLPVRLIPLAEMVRVKLGLAVSENTTSTATALGLGPGQSLLIEKVEKDSPADRAQLQPGFLLEQIDGLTSGKIQNVAQVLSEKNAGDSVHLTVVAPRMGRNYVEYRQAAVDVVVR